MRILIIGGTRFIGPHVVRRLAGAGHHVTLFHRGETEADLPGGVEQLHGDRRDLQSFAGEFRRLSPDVVLDMVAYTEEEALAFVNVFKDVAGRLVVVSSADVYRAYGLLLRTEEGEPVPVPLREDAPLRSNLYPYRARVEGPDDYKYHYDKILVERAVMNSGLPWTVLRLCAVYGPGDFQHRVFHYLKRMDDGRPAVLLEEGQSRWRWTLGFVLDVAEGIALAVGDERAAGRVYNVGEPEALTVSDWVHEIGHAAGWDGQIVVLPKEAMPGGMLTGSAYENHLVLDTGRIREELGYAERFSRREALHATIDWERKNPPAEVGAGQFDYAAEDEALKNAKVT